MLSTDLVALCQAALYSAVLTAFIIVSMSLLREDTAEVTRDILLTITKQLANQSTPAYERPSFEAPPHAVRVNVFFFMSIILSLAAALGAVLALQWVGKYDFRLNPSSPKDRALQRHFRFVGIENWKMAEIIAFLPIFLFLSLFLFLVGLADWLFHIHKAVAVVVMVGLAIAVIFYVSTTIIAIRYIEAPFRTSVSKSIPFIYYESIKLINAMTDLLFGRKRSNGITNEIHSSFSKREITAIRTKSSLEAKTLLWAISSIDILPHSRNIFKTLLEGFMELPTEQLLQPKIGNAPWVPVFTLLCQPYLGRRERGDYSKEELESGEVPFLLRSLAMVGNIQMDEAASKEILSSIVIPFSPDAGYPKSDTLSAYAGIALLKSGYLNTFPYSKAHIHDTIANLHTLPVAFSQLSLKMLHNSLLTDRGAFFSTPTLRYWIAEYCNVDSQTMTSPVLLPYELLPALLQILATDLSGHISSVDDPLRAYLNTYEQAQRDGHLDIAHREAHKAIRRQYIFRLSQINWGVDPLFESNEVIKSIYDLLSLSSGEARVAAVRDIFTVLLAKPFRNKWSGSLTQNRLRIALLAFCHPPVLEPHQSDLVAARSTQRRLLSNACDKVINDSIYTMDDRVAFIRLFCRALGGVHISRRDFDDWVGNPAILLAIWAIQDLRGQFPGLSTFPLELWQDPVWSKVAEWAFNCAKIGHGNLQHPQFSSLVRNALTNGSLRVRRSCIQMLAYLRGHDVGFTSISGFADLPFL